ncbi:uncharacterized protein LOC117641028, partial [Thrips palmi]|uniref:Uncharacterized protein LOC117641028 n=1 Tax=Thrips palmi TaxID=161013 RepID=A0A6P8Y3D8_THRPL
MRVARAVVGRRRYAGYAAGSWLRTLLLLFVVSFVWLQLHLAGLGLGFNGRGWRSNGQDGSEANDSAAILAMVPQVLHKYLMARPRNQTQAGPGGAAGAWPPAPGNDSVQRSFA